MTISYRIDYAVGSNIVAVFELTKSAAMAKARKMSKTHGIAYAIASEDGQDTGQRVYVDGCFSYADDQF